VNRKETADRARAKRLMDNYKLTVEQYDAILVYQQGVCYACGEAEPVKGRRLSVDHDHATGEVRGLLCSRCNPILGKLERAFMRYGLGKVLGFSVVKYALRIGLYLREPPAAKALGMRHFGYSGRTGTKAHRAKLRRERKQNATPRTAITEKTEGN
jgi:Recombination endonuclease VII